MKDEGLSKESKAIIIGQIKDLWHPEFDENDMRLRILQSSVTWSLTFLSVALIAPLAATPTQGSDDFRYLLVRRAGTPEKNYYEFARRLTGILDADLEFHSSIDVVTEDPGSIRYGVYRIYRARVLQETDSEKQPASVAEGAFVLIYRRDSRPEVLRQTLPVRERTIGSTQDYIH
jgi:hypothetical protein